MVTVMRFRLHSCAVVCSLAFPAGAVAQEAAFDTTAVLAALLEADPNTTDEEGQTPLHWIARHLTDPTAVAALLERGADPRARDEEGRTPLHLAAARDDAAAVVEALLAGVQDLPAGVAVFLEGVAEVDARDSSGRTPLHFASVYGTPDVVAALLSAGADVNARVAEPEYPFVGGDTPLHLAAREGRPGVVEALLAAGANPSASNRADSSTPLHVAASHGRLEAARSLIRAGVDPNAGTGYHSHPPLYEAAVFGLGGPVEMVEMIALLTDMGADPNPLVDGWADGPRTLLHVVAEVRDSATVAALLRAGANPLVTFTPGNEWLPRTPIVHAILAGEVDDRAGIVGAFLAGGVDPNSKYGAWPLLELAVEYDQPDVLATLLRAGADPTARNAAGETPLFSASRSEDSSMAEALLEAGADPNATDEWGTSVLHVATYSRNVGVVRMLLGKGADFRVENADGKTPLEWAEDEFERNFPNDSALRDVIALIREAEIRPDFLRGHGGPVAGLGSEHGAGHREQAVSNRTEGAGMAVVAQGGVLGLADGVALDRDPGVEW